MTRTCTVIPFAPFILLAFAAPEPGASQSPGDIPSASPDSAPRRILANHGVRT